MLWAVLNKVWRQGPAKQQLCGHLPPSEKLSKLDEADMQGTAGEVGTNSWAIYFSGRVKVGRSVGTYIQEHCADIGCSLEDPPGVMDDRDVLQRCTNERFYYNNYTTKHLYHHASSGSMRVGLRCKCQLDLLVTSTVKQRDRSDECQSLLANRAICLMSRVFTNLPSPCRILCGPSVFCHI